VFNNNKKQFINILQQNKQLKLDYKTIEDNKILKEEQSTFLITDNSLPKDAVFKINSLQKNINHTYIVSLFENINQNIVATNTVDVISYDAIKINHKNSITIPKNEIHSTCRYFENIGIDYILSPYTIIEEYLIDNGKKNSFNLFIYNNIIYSIIFDNQKELAFSKIKVLTPFESTQDETFFDDDIVGQKLYEEVNFLEIQEFLNETVTEYYGKNTDEEFLEDIEILYTLRPMSEEQLSLLQEIMMIPITYRSISIDNYMDEIVQKKDSTTHNFITPRVKKEDKSIYLWVVLALLSIVLGIGVFNFQLDTKEDAKEIIKTEIVKKEKQKIVKQKEIESVEILSVLLPDHTKINTNTLQKMKMLFDVVPYDAVLKDIEINKNSSTFVSSFIVNSKSIFDMQTKLKNLYNTSKILLQHKNQAVLNTIIENNNLMPKYSFSKNVKDVEYKKYNFLPTAKATSYLRGLVIADSLITYDSKNTTEYTSYNFSITSKIKSPEEFFAFIEKVNQQQLSVELAYPIIFSRTTNFIEVKYKLKLNQHNKKQVELIK
jgi:hypothetical protein